jgi:NADH:ubiquinone oxidoreductase subunit 5 (subunit L)/multisubunit Na+/H+ antiporter MnhA subunit
VGEFLPLYIKLLPFIGSIVSILVIIFINNSGLFYTKDLYNKEEFRSIYRFLAHKWYFDTVYNRIVNQPLLESSYNVVFSLIDKGILEFFGPSGLSALSTRLGWLTNFAQSGRVYDYGWLMLGILYLFILIDNILNN